MGSPDDALKQASARVLAVAESWTYWDVYGTEVLGFLALASLTGLVVAGSSVLQTRRERADRWPEVRCRPDNLAFAGLISRSPTETWWEATQNNATYCFQRGLSELTATSTQPITFLLASLTSLATDVVNSVQDMRTLTDTLRQGMASVGMEAFYRLLNVILPLQAMMIAAQDTFQKLQAVLVTGLMTLLGSYFALQSLLGAILQFIVQLLVVLAILIVGLWIVPFTWPVASAMTVVFLSVSIPLAIMLVFMQDVMHIKTPGLPQLRCFDPATPWTLTHGRTLAMAHLQPGDVLADESVVTAVMCVSARDLPLFVLPAHDNAPPLVLSGTHWVWDPCRHEWGPVRDVAAARPYVGPPLSHVRCVQTSAKWIRHASGWRVADWDDWDADTRARWEQAGSPVFPSPDVGYDPSCWVWTHRGRIPMDEVELGDRMSKAGQGEVYGVVGLPGGRRHLLVVGGRVVVGPEAAVESDYGEVCDAWGRAFT
jgi:hypothetical protein